MIVKKIVMYPPSTIVSQVCDPVNPLSGNRAPSGVSTAYFQSVNSGAESYKKLLITTDKLSEPIDFNEVTICPRLPGVEKSVERTIGDMGHGSYYMVQHICFLIYLPAFKVVLEKLVLGLLLNLI